MTFLLTCRKLLARPKLSFRFLVMDFPNYISTKIRIGISSHLDLAKESVALSLA